MMKGDDYEEGDLLHKPCSRSNLFEKEQKRENNDVEVEIEFLVNFFSD